LAIGLLEIDDKSDASWVSRGMYPLPVWWQMREDVRSSQATSRRWGRHDVKEEAMTAVATEVRFAQLSWKKWLLIVFFALNEIAKAQLHSQPGSA